MEQNWQFKPRFPCFKEEASLEKEQAQKTNSFLPELYLNVNFQFRSDYKKLKIAYFNIFEEFWGY